MGPGLLIGIVCRFWILGREVCGMAPQGGQIWLKAKITKIGGKRSQGQWRMRQHHRLNVHEFKQNLGDGGGQGSLVCSSPRGRKELNTT